MFKRFIVRNTAIVFLSLLVLSCQKEEEIDLSNINLLSVSFQKANNPSLDSDIMYNSLQIRKLDQQIYKIDKQIQLLKLYVRVENAI